MAVWTPDTEDPDRLPITARGILVFCFWATLVYVGGGLVAYYLIAPLISWQ